VILEDRDESKKKAQDESPGLFGGYSSVDVLQFEFLGKVGRGLVYRWQ
jgi:hypothetical protein